MSMKLLFQLKPLVIQCLNFAPVKVFFTLLTMLLNNVSSGIGILLIIPLLASVGVEIGIANAPLAFVESIRGAADVVGLTLNLQSILLTYLCLIIAVATLNFANAVLTTSLSQSFVVFLRRKLTRSLFYTQWCYLNSEHMSDFVRLLTSQTQSVGMSLQLLLRLSNSLIMVCVYLVLSISISPKVTLIALACACCLVLVLWPINKLIYASGNVGLTANKSIYRLILNNIGSLKVIKSFAAEARYLKRMNSINSELEYQQIRMAKYNALTRWVNMVGAAVIFTLLFYSSIEWLSLPVGNLLVILLIFSRLMPQVSSVQGTLQQLIHQAPTYVDLLEQENKLKLWRETGNQSDQAPSFQNHIELKGIRYQYDDESSDAFGPITKKIKRNETVAIVGPSGSGKSTFADVISGLIAPSGGALLVDGVEIDDDNRLAWRKRVAYVTQDVFLFHESIRNNLSWVYPSEKLTEEVPESELWAVLKQAAADDFVRALPQGLDTIIGDRGVKLSGGQRQRLVLARALLSNPDILILDEATSALDRQNELKIRDALVNLDGTLTLFIIAHNETTIEHVTNRVQFT